MQPLAADPFREWIGNQIGDTKTEIYVLSARGLVIYSRDQFGILRSRSAEQER